MIQPSAGDIAYFVSQVEGGDAGWPETDEEQEDYIDWINSVNDENTILGFREWLLTIQEDESD